MTENTEVARYEVLSLTTEIISAHVSNNSVNAEDLPSLIQSVYEKLSELSTPAVEKTAAAAPAVPIKKSVTDDYIICLEDGRKLKMLKRHLATSYNLTPDEYRAKWGLPPSYPMVAPNYAAKRQALAKQIGLGRKKKS